MEDLFVKKKINKNYTCRKYRKCLLYYKAKFTFCSCSLLLKQKLKIVAKELTDNKTFRFRNDLLLKVSAAQKKCK